MSQKDALIPQGAAFFPTTGQEATRNYAFILVPGFTLLAFSSAVEPLRIANQLSQKPLYSWTVLSENGEPVESSSGIALDVDGKLENLDKSVRLFVSAGNSTAASESPAIVAATHRHYRFGGVVGGICTGAVALARAGLLEGRRFTLHWENQPAFLETFRDLTPTSARYESDDRIVTCGGGAASMDMMLNFIAQDHGDDFATMVSEMCLLPVMSGTVREQRSSLGALMASRNPLLLKTVQHMQNHIDSPLTVEELAQLGGCSRRHLERLFDASIGQAPKRFYIELRLDRGRNLLSTTELSLLEIAMACGFESVSHFSKNFRRKFGVSPTRLKQTVGMRKP